MGASFRRVETHFRSFLVQGAYQPRLGSLLLLPQWLRHLESVPLLQTPAESFIQADRICPAEGDVSTFALGKPPCLKLAVSLRIQAQPSVRIARCGSSVSRLPATKRRSRSSTGRDGYSPTSSPRRCGRMRATAA